MAETLLTTVGSMSHAVEQPGSAWLDGKINNEHAAILANVERNIRRPLPQVQPYMPQDAPIGLLAGGPSLADHEDEIRERHANGMKFVTVNGTHDWLLDRGIRPAAHVMVDSRKFNVRFVKNWQEKTTYFIASQCHPAIFDALDKAKVYIFHSGGDSLQLNILDQHYMGHYFRSLGGSTVMLRAIQLLRTIGFTHME